MRAAFALTVFGVMKKQSPPLYWRMKRSVCSIRPRFGAGAGAGGGAAAAGGAAGFAGVRVGAGPVGAACFDGVSVGAGSAGTASFCAFGAGDGFFAPSEEGGASGPDCSAKYAAPAPQIVSAPRTPANTFHLRWLRAKGCARLLSGRRPSNSDKN